MGAEERRREIAGLDYRAELRSAGDDEDTGQVDMVAMSRAPKSSSTPPKAKAIATILAVRPSAWMVALILGTLGILWGSGTIGAVLARLGWVK